MSPEESALRAAINADPDSDLPRLVFADWLDERDDPLGLFIRVQIELDPIRDQIELPRVRELLAIEGQLLRDHEEDWLGPRAEFHHLNSEDGPHFRRGFPHSLHLHAGLMDLYGLRLKELYPTVRELEVSWLGDDGLVVGNHPLLAQLDSFELADLPTPAQVELLIGRELFQRIPLVRFWTAGDGFCPISSFSPHKWRPAGHVELVQLVGGVIAGSDRDAYDREAEQCAARLNAVWGEGVVRVVRPFQRLFPIHEGENKILGGRFPTGRIGIAFLQGSRRDNRNELPVVELAEDGHVEMRLEPLPQTHRWPELVTWVRESLGLRAEFIRVPEFLTDGGQSIRLWQHSNPAELTSHFMGDDVWGWLHSQCFCVANGYVMGPGMANGFLAQ